MTANDADKKPQITQNAVTESQSDNAADGLAGIKELAMLDDGTLDKITKLERYIFYRQFYFPRGQPKWKQPGIGQNTSEVEYDGIAGDHAMLDQWDPRYLYDYIQQAKNDGFHRHFLYFDGSDVVSINFEEAYQILSMAFESDTKFKDEYKTSAYGVLSGLRYMDKLDIFCNDEGYGEQLGRGKRALETIINNGESYIDKADTRLKTILGQTRDTFCKKVNNSGWYSQDMKYAFDVKQYAAEWEQLQEKYKEYKEKIWNILKNVKNLNLCTNNVSGINVGNVNINQMATCNQTIQNATNVDDPPATPPKQPDPPKPATPAAQDPPKQPDPPKSNKTTYIVVGVVVTVIITIGITVTFILVRGNNNMIKQLEVARTNINETI